MTHALTPKYSTQQSFYGKAKVDYYEVANGRKVAVLYSYDTFIMEIDCQTKKIIDVTDDAEHFTNTTLKHIKEFMLQQGLASMTKMQLLRIGSEIDAH